MPIAITKSTATRFSPNCFASYWVAQRAQILNLASDATLMIQGFYDQAGYDAKDQFMESIKITIPAASVETALATDEALGTYLLTLPQFAGGTAAEVV